MNLQPNRRAAIYARFSSDLQNDRSIEDQIALCNTYAIRTSARIVRSYHDRARTGASIMGRDGLLQLMEDARNGAFDVVIVEALDRLSRDQEDLAGIYKRLEFAGISIEAVHDGVADQVQIGVRGLLGSLYLADLKHKTRRGLVGVVKAGRTAGGKSYGYRPVPGRPGELEIVEEEAEIVRRIFREYASGLPPRQIAQRLNREGVAAPRGPQWSASTINGNLSRGYGLLCNPLYVGQIIWNRVRMVRDPDTGKRVNRVNPKEEWLTSERPELAIVDRETWDAVQRVKAAKSPGGGWTLKKTRRLLSGLVLCGECGGSMVTRSSKNGRFRLACSRARESGSCSSKRTVYVDALERAVVELLFNTLDRPEVLRLYVDTYRKEMMRITADARKSVGKYERELREAEKRIDQLSRMIGEAGVPFETIRDRLREAEAQRQQLEEQLSAARSSAPVISLHPEAVQRWRDDLAVMRERLTEDGELDEVGQRVRDLIDSVIVTFGPKGQPPMVEVKGRLAALIGGPSSICISMVAGEGLEPSTSGL